MRLIVLFYHVLFTASLLPVQFATSQEEGEPSESNSAKLSDNFQDVTPEVADLWSYKYYAAAIDKIRDDSAQSEIIKEIHRKLTNQLQISATLEHEHGVRFKDSKWVRCSGEYAEKQLEFEQESKFLLSICQMRFGAMSPDSIRNVPVDWKNILSRCARRASELTDLAVEMDGILNMSVICATWSAGRALNELRASKYFEKIENGNKLLYQELGFLMDTFESFIFKEFNSTEGVLSAEVGRANLEQINADRNEVDTFMTSEKIQGRWKTITDLNNAIKQIPPMNVSLIAIREVASYLENEILQKYLKTSMVKQVDYQQKNLADLGLLRSYLTSKVTQYSDMMISLNIIQKEKQTSLYTKTSPTFGIQCENSQAHPIGTCTPENNEVCRSILELGVDIPKESGEEVVTKPPNVKLCLCSFREDCSKDKSGELGPSCLMIPNMEGQCRGAVGYPCKSQPLGVGKFHESCESEYCNLKTDACAFHDDVVDTASISKLKRKLKQILH